MSMEECQAFRQNLHCWAQAWYKYCASTQNHLFLHGFCLSSIPGFWMLHSHSIITFSCRMSNCNEMLQCMRRGKTIGMLYRLFLATSLSNGCCPHRLFWTIRCISWMVYPPALPSCLQLWQSVLERSDAELGQVAASLLLFQPSCGLNRDLLTCSSKINTPDMFFWPK